MAKLYGTLTNQDSKTATKTASSIITAAAQSHNGSVSVTISFVDGVEQVQIAAGKGSDSDPSHVLLSAPLSVFLMDTVVLGITAYGNEDEYCDEESVWLADTQGSGSV